MSEPSVEPVHRPMLYRAVMEVLAEESPLKRGRRSTASVRLQDQLTDYEKATFRDRDNTRRWENILSWETTAIGAVGWMTKGTDGWAITDAAARR